MEKVHKSSFQNEERYSLSCIESFLTFSSNAFSSEKEYVVSDVLSCRNARVFSRPRPTVERNRKPLHMEKVAKHKKVHKIQTTDISLSSLVFVNVKDHVHFIKVCMKERRKEAYRTAS